MTLAPPAPARSTAVMSAVTITAPGSIRMDRIPVPEPGPNEVRVRLEGCGVSAEDFMAWEGRPALTYPLSPGAPGHEGWGRIDALGREVRGLEIGQRVTLASGRAFAEHDVAPAERVVALPESLGDLPFPGPALGRALSAHDRARIRPGQTVAVIGVGFLGALQIRLAARAGARVIAITRRVLALDLARRMGAAEAVVLRSRDSAAAQVLARTGGHGCDRVVETVGGSEALGLAAAIAGDGARLVVARAPARAIDVAIPGDREIEIVAADEPDPRRRVEAVRAAVRAVVDGTLDPRPLFTHQFLLDRLDQALEIVRERPGRFMKALVLA